MMEPPPGVVEIKLKPEKAAEAHREAIRLHRGAGDAVKKAVHGGGLAVASRTLVKMKAAQASSVRQRMRRAGLRGV